LNGKPAWMGIMGFRRQRFAENSFNEKLFHQTDAAATPAVMSYHQNDTCFFASSDHLPGICNVRSNGFLHEHVLS
jgi:hypothetical protein